MDLYYKSRHKDTLSVTINFILFCVYLLDYSPISAAIESSAETEKILIAYFTWAENAADTSRVDATTSASVQAPGNVARMAAWIQQETGGDLFSIRVEEPYSADYDECLDCAADEKAENARPVLVEKVLDMAGYDTVFYYPNL